VIYGSCRKKRHCGIKTEEMPMWTWIAIGVGVFFVLGTAVALVVARTIGLIARDVSALYDADPWSEMPLSREAQRQTKAGSEKGVAA
jgi:hypothetical protein